MTPQFPETRFVYVADRQADMLPLKMRVQELGTPAGWLARAAHNQALAGGEKPWMRTCSGHLLGQIEFAMPARDGAKGCELRQQSLAQRVDLSAGT